VRNGVSEESEIREMDVAVCRRRETTENQRRSARYTGGVTRVSSELAGT